MTDNPLPPALAALKRYALKLADTDPMAACLSPVDNGAWLLLDDVLAVWPTQAQGEAVAWMVYSNVVNDCDYYVFANHDDADSYACDIDESASAIIPLYTHPSPSTAALREQIESLMREKAHADLTITTMRKWEDTLRAELDAAKVNEARYLWLRDKSGAVFNEAANYIEQHAPSTNDSDDKILKGINDCINEFRYSRDWCAEAQLCLRLAWNRISGKTP
jgi:hypothetical protein